MAYHSIKMRKKFKDSKCGSYDYATDYKNITTVKWFDNKCVIIISIYCEVEPVKNVKRWYIASKSFIDDKHIDSLFLIFATKGWIVELMNMLVELYYVDIHAKGYYLRIISPLLDICVANAWFFYRRHLQQISSTKAKYLSLYDFHHWSQKHYWFMVNASALEGDQTALTVLQ